MTLLKQLWKRKALALLLLLVTFGTATSQEKEPLFDELTETFKKKYLSIGILLQIVGDYQPQRSFAGNNGFNVGNFRLKLSGELDQRFGYLLQTSFTRSPAILDAKMYFRAWPAIIIDAGLFKSPFSKELLTGAGAIDFVNRAQVVTALAPARQIGVQVTNWLQEDVLSFAAGAFNGNGIVRNNNDNKHLLYGGRLTWLPSMINPEDEMEVGINIAFSEDDNVSLAGLTSDFNGSRFLFGGDFRLTHGRFLFSSEAIFSRLTPHVGTSVNPYGLHVTAGYMISDKSQLLLRWDGIYPDMLQPDSDLIIFGYNLWPTKATELQVNYIIPTKKKLDNQQLLVNVQLAF